MAHHNRQPQWTIVAGGLVLSVFTSPVLAGDPSAAALQKLHTDEARAYHIYRDEAHTQPLALTEKPVFSWTNEIRENRQQGHLFVWMADGRPEVIGTMFSAPERQTQQRAVIHEFHTLSTAKLFPVSPDNSNYDWLPTTGIEFRAAEAAPDVSPTPGPRLQQMRSIARKYSAQTLNVGDQQTFELRLLPTPLLHYKPGSAEVLEGAVFAMVSSAGTDPELLILVEARRPDGDQSRWEWQAATARFTDRELTVSYDGQPVWSSLADPARHADIKNNYTLIETPDHAYSCFRARMIAELPDGE